jgi:hypothetical protein
MAFFHLLHKFICKLVVEIGGRPLKGGSREKTPLRAKNKYFSLEP